MKAAQILNYGGQNAISVNDNVEKPVISDDQVLVEVHAAGVNPFDWKVREGAYQQSIALTLPATLGGDVAGTIVEVGGKVEGFSVGQTVYGSANAAGGQGSFAEFTAVSAKQLAIKPNKLSSTEAGAAPLTSASAYQAIVETMNVQPGQKILIHGGAGGIGSVAIQLAKHLGAHVITTVSAEDAEFAAKLGADEVIDYRSQDFSELVHEADVVFDTVGGTTNTKSYAVLKPGGVFVSMVEPADDAKVTEKKLRYVQQSSRATSERLKKVSDLFESGDLKIFVDKVFPFEEVARALEYVKTGHPTGKVVIQVKR